MANYTSLDYKKFGPNIMVTDGADTLALVINPVKSDSFAVFSSKIIASAPLTSESFAFTAVGEDLRTTVTGASGITPSGTALLTDDLCVAVFSSVSQKVHVVQDATNRIITAQPGDTVDIPNLVSFIREATAAV